MWQVFQEQNKVEVPHNFNTCRKGSFPVWHQICWDPMNLCTILRQTVTWGPTIKEYMKRNQPGNESIWDKARLSNKWQKDDDPKYQEETAEYDGAPQQVWLEINILMYNNRFYLVKALDPSLNIVRMKTDILIHWYEASHKNQWVSMSVCMDLALPGSPCDRLIATTNTIWKIATWWEPSTNLLVNFGQK